MSVFCHGDKITGKLKYETTSEGKQLLCEVKDTYEEWKENTLAVVGILQKDIERKVDLLNNYKKFLNQPKFKKWAGNNSGSSYQSKLHSSVLEEFMYYLCKDIPGINNKHIHLGTTKVCTHMTFPSLNIDTLEKSSYLITNSKNIDFAIAVEVEIRSGLPGSKELPCVERIYEPLVYIECKTWIDKTMFDGINGTIEHIKRSYSNCLSLIVTEDYEIGKKFDPRYSYVDQIYLLKLDGRKSPISSEVVCDLIKDIRIHISAPLPTIEERKKKGKLI